MAKIQPELTLLDDGQVQLSLNAPDMSKLILPQPPEDAQTTLVKYVVGGRIVSVGGVCLFCMAQKLCTS